MTGKQRAPTTTKKRCDKCGRDLNVRGFKQHYAFCNGDPNRPTNAEDRKKYVREQKKIESQGKTPASPTPGSNSTNEIKNTIPTVVETTVNMPEVHTTVPVAPTTNEHGGVVPQDHNGDVPSGDEDDDDNDEWDGYLC